MLGRRAALSRIRATGSGAFLRLAMPCGESRSALLHERETGAAMCRAGPLRCGGRSRAIYRRENCGPRHLFSGGSASGSKGSTRCSFLRIRLPYRGGRLLARRSRAGRICPRAVSRGHYSICRSTVEEHAALPMVSRFRAGQFPSRSQAKRQSALQRHRPV